MANTRDDFSSGVKRVLAYRAGFRCSKPSCRTLTIGPSLSDCGKYTNIGVASHISAASPGGPRFDAALTSEERCSLRNGIWLCQSHAKEIDDDPAFYSVELLHAWKEDVEREASAIIGVPLSSQSLEVLVQVVMHRVSTGGLVVTGTTNFPTGTKLWVELHNGRELIGTSTVIVNEGQFVSDEFSQAGEPHLPKWYTIEVLAYFNGPWQQPDAVMAIVGEEGRFLEGEFVERIHPEFVDSQKRFRAEFSSIAPARPGVILRTSEELEDAIEIVRRAVLEVDGRQSAEPVAAVVEWYMKAPGLRPNRGWAAHPLPNGAVVVSYSFLKGDQARPDTSEWTVLIESREVRYRNLNGKYMSYLSAD